MVYTYELTKGPDWAITSSAQTGATDVNQSQHYVYRITCNHAVMHQMRALINMGRPAKLRFTLPVGATYERYVIIDNYQFWWKLDQSGQIGRADIVFNVSTIQVGNLNDIANDATKLAIIVGD